MTSPRPSTRFAWPSGSPGCRPMRNLLAGFHWRDTLDVFLVALIVYRLLVAFRRTRAAQILVGLGVLLAGALGARRLGVPTIGWLLDTVLASWAGLLVVLFQSDLRRAL